MKILLIARTVALSLAASSALLAAPVKKLVPANKNSEPKLIREVLGTEQLVGYEGAFRQMFTLGKQNAFNFIVNKAEYSVGRVNLGAYSHLPKGDEKFLVLHFTIHNPQKTPLDFSSSYLTLKAIDATGVTRTALTDIGREITSESLRFTLQPGQKVDGYTAIPVAAFGEVPKLIVQNSYDLKAPIVRYDLRGKVAKLVAPAGDETGVSSPKLIPAKMGVDYPVTDNFDLRVDKVDYVDGKLGGREAAKGQQFCTATVTITNRSTKPQRYSSAYFRADLKDVDGEKMEYTGRLLKTSLDKESGVELAPGENIQARFYWPVPIGDKAKTVLLQYGYDRESRSYGVDVTG